VRSLNNAMQKVLLGMVELREENEGLKRRVKELEY
jgi:hypothetical protein